MIILLLLILIPAALGGLSFAVASDAQRPWMLVLAGVLHSALVASLWVSGTSPSAGKWLMLDAAGKLVLSLSSVLFCPPRSTPSGISAGARSARTTSS